MKLRTTVQLSSAIQTIQKVTKLSVITDRKGFHLRINTVQTLVKPENFSVIVTSVRILTFDENSPQFRPEK